MLSAVHSLCLSREVFYKRLVGCKEYKGDRWRGKQTSLARYEQGQQQVLDLVTAFDTETEHNEFELKES
jgi:hypothetical protein